MNLRNLQHSNASCKPGSHVHLVNIHQGDNCHIHNDHCHGDPQMDLLCKYKDMFPASFIECMKEGVSWLCSHNNITYQSAVMFRSDSFIYDTSGVGLLQVGLIDRDKPLTGLSFYDLVSIEEAIDTNTGNTVYKIKTKYSTPMGLTSILIPIKYFIPNCIQNDVYTVKEVNELLAKLEFKLTKLIPTAEEFVKVEDIGKVITNIDLDIKDLQNRVNDIEQSTGVPGFGLTLEQVLDAIQPGDNITIKKNDTGIVINSTAQAGAPGEHTNIIAGKHIKLTKVDNDVTIDVIMPPVTTQGKLVAGDNIHLDQQGDEITISSYELKAGKDISVNKDITNKEITIDNTMVVTLKGNPDDIRDKLVNPNGSYK